MYDVREDDAYDSIYIFYLLKKKDEANAMGLKIC